MALNLSKLFGRGGNQQAKFEAGSGELMTETATVVTDNKDPDAFVTPNQKQVLVNAEGADSSGAREFLPTIPNEGSAVHDIHINQGPANNVHAGNTSTDRGIRGAAAGQASGSQPGDEPVSQEFSLPEVGDEVLRSRAGSLGDGINVSGGAAFQAPSYEIEDVSQSLGPDYAKSAPGEEVEASGVYTGLNDGTLLGVRGGGPPQGDAVSEDMAEIILNVQGHGANDVDVTGNETTRGIQLPDWNAARGEQASAGEVFVPEVMGKGPVPQVVQDRMLEATQAAHDASTERSGQVPGQVFTSGPVTGVRPLDAAGSGTFEQAVEPSSIEYPNLAASEANVSVDRRLVENQNLDGEATGLVQNQTIDMAKVGVGGFGSEMDDAGVTGGLATPGAIDVALNADETAALAGDRFVAAREANVDVYGGNSGSPVGFDAGTVGGLDTDAGDAARGREGWIEIIAAREAGPGTEPLGFDRGYIGPSAAREAGSGMGPGADPESGSTGALDGRLGPKTDAVIFDDTDGVESLGLMKSGGDHVTMENMTAPGAGSPEGILPFVEQQNVVEHQNIVFDHSTDRVRQTNLSSSEAEGDGQALGFQPIDALAGSGVAGPGTTAYDLNPNDLLVVGSAQSDVEDSVQTARESTTGIHDIHMNQGNTAGVVEAPEDEQILIGMLLPNAKEEGDGPSGFLLDERTQQGLEAENGGLDMADEGPAFGDTDFATARRAQHTVDLPIASVAEAQAATDGADGNSDNFTIKVEHEGWAGIGAEAHATEEGPPMEHVLQAREAGSGMATGRGEHQSVIEFQDGDDPLTLTQRAVPAGLSAPGPQDGDGPSTLLGDAPGDDGGDTPTDQMTLNFSKMEFVHDPGDAGLDADFDLDGDIEVPD